MLCYATQPQRRGSLERHSLISMPLLPPTPIPPACRFLPRQRLASTFWMQRHGGPSGALLGMLCGPGCTAWPHCLAAWGAACLPALLAALL